MKLLSSALSPFAARVRLAIHAYSLPVEIAPANLWLAAGQQKSPEYLAINPIGKVPTLILEDGTVIPESDTIVEYLADAFPNTGLRPNRAQDMARARLLPRIYEQYVQTTAWGALFGQVFAQTRDPAAIEAAHTRVHAGLGYLEHFMSDDPFAVSDRITTADCALVPFCYYHALLLRTHGKEDPSLSRPKLAAYLERIHPDPVIQRIVAEIREGLATSRLAVLLG